MRPGIHSNGYVVFERGVSRIFYYITQIYLLTRIAVPVFEREARVKFFVTFESEFERVMFE